jgi:hypothetical protein
MPGSSVSTPRRPFFRGSILFLLVSLLFVFVGCDKNKTTPPISSDPLVGYWINRQYSDSGISFERSSSLKDADYGLALKADGNLIERKNAGWCGTPPITYDDFEGNWTKNDSMLNITTSYWGGNATYKWKVLSVTASSLSVQLISEEYQDQTY